MEKTNRALIGVEENAEAIRLLNARVSEVEANSDMSVKDDVKRALTGVQENREMLEHLDGDVTQYYFDLRKLTSRVFDVETAVNGFNIMCVPAQEMGIQGFFGIYKFHGPTALIIYGPQTEYTVVLNRHTPIGKFVGTGVLCLDSDANSTGNGELIEVPYSEGTTLLLIGQFTKTI
ncbi:MAG: hypothetical protein J1G38_03265 [Clostridiales bacterium]|nr:hypothetical protein [Clostridiales bacterium]